MVRVECEERRRCVHTTDDSCSAHACPAYARERNGHLPACVLCVEATSDARGCHHAHSL